MSSNCQLCGAPTRAIHHRRFGTYHCCEACGFIGKDAASLITPEAELAIYDSHNNSVEDPRYVAYFREFLDTAIFPFAGSGKRGLDFGSGPSPVLAQLLERDYGFDMDIYDLFYAPEKIYEGKRYNLVTSTEVVEHLKDPLAYFKLFADLLEEDGTLAVMTQFHPSDDAAFLNWHYIRDRSHIAFYTPGTLKLIAEKSGLVLIHTDNRRSGTFRKAGTL